MKKYLFIILVVLMFVFALSLETMAMEFYTWGSVGGSDAFSFSIGFSRSSLGDSSWGFELGSIADGKITSSDYLDYACPHYDYTTLGWKKEGSTLGIDILYLRQLLKKIIAYGGIGIYVAKNIKIVESNTTGWWYNHGEKSEISIPFSLGIRLVEEKYFLGLGYHGERGINAQIGFNLSNKQ